MQPDVTEKFSIFKLKINLRNRNSTVPAKSNEHSFEKMKYILVTGGVLSGIGKGVIASSTGVLMKSLGYRVTSVKIDPYINIDAGTMSPFEHGKVL